MFDGNLQALADRLRRHPREARALRVWELVQTLSERWREAPDMLSISDEVPVGAWVVRKKVWELLPQKEPVDLPAVNSDPGEVPTWIEPAVRSLAECYRQTGLAYARPPIGIERSPAPVKAADAVRLAQSWPRLRAPVVPPEVVVSADEDPLDQRLEQLRRSLHRQGRWLFPPHGRPARPAEVVATFLALLILWNQGEVEIAQPAGGGPLEVKWHG